MEAMTTSTKNVFTFLEQSQICMAKGQESPKNANKTKAK